MRDEPGLELNTDLNRWPPLLPVVSQMGSSDLI